MGSWVDRLRIARVMNGDVLVLDPTSAQVTLNDVKPLELGCQILDRRAVRSVKWADNREQVRIL